ncbi:hypothetical protein [Chitinophaga sp. MM2321]|uniref:hypothetical protein n=1 Tax=Chitinophaga sp. MM2321 TaxID=3137178 RepID=UPI0032D5874F
MLSPTIHTAWIQDCSEEVSHYDIPVLTLRGEGPFTEPTFFLNEAHRADETKAREFFKRNDAEPQDLEDTIYQLSDFDIDEEVLAEIRHALIEL